MKKLFLINVYRKKEKVRKYIEALSLLFDGGLQVVEEGELKTVSGPAIITGSERMVGEDQVSQQLLDFVLETSWPLLGICYGHQAIGKAYGHGVVKCGKHRGPEFIVKTKDSPLLRGLPRIFQMDESHYECVEGEGPLEVVAVNRENPQVVETLQDPERGIFGVQFHPERTPEGRNFVLQNFLSLSFGA